ncbi:MAG: bifunctional adenosylcobinamide kinase/adenosylcobinamide-phosphate guanylyltransferase [Acidobacteria bacterium]|nr:MAG: bifunctional adenosylcobinamide kinase/adenosylcobinamide-phosphate guanylyltransferase [Acidobacteriota bacterium]
MGTDVLTLITGSARSGKTRHALNAALETPRIYFATAQLLDEEMRERAARHRAERADGWQTIEEPFQVAQRLRELSGTVVLDCLTLWLSNWMLHDASQLDSQIDELCVTLRNVPYHVIAITNEVGWSIVPENALARRFRDWSGVMNQRVAAAADSVVLMVCGIPTKVK